LTARGGRGWVELMPQSFNSSILLSLIYCVLLISLVLYFVNCSKKVNSRKKPVGKGEKMHREAGHSLSAYIESKQEKLLILLACSIFVPISLITGSVYGLEWYWTIPLLLGLAVASALLIRKKVLRLSDLHLGLQGERLVGETINWLMKDGFDVFHDYPIDPNGKSGNIDHIVVGPNGVFAIETKAVRKPTDDSIDKNYEVSFDGKSLKYPHFSTKNGGTRQALHNSQFLSKELSASLDEPIQVHPILTLPGWFVDSSSKSPLMVLNPKNIRANILRKDSVIDESLQRKIAHRIKERCQDVSF
jgi:hypothetical protein